jgi:hypothetical protein
VNDAPSPRRRGRSVLAVLAGLVVIFVLSIGTDQILHATGVYPPWGQPMADSLFALATAYRIVYGVLGCWIAARLAPDRPMKHALILGLIGFVFSLAGLVFAQKQGPELGPLSRSWRSRCPAPGRAGGSGSRSCGRAPPAEPRPKKERGSRWGTPSSKIEPISSTRAY